MGRRTTSDWLWIGAMVGSAGLLGCGDGGTAPSGLAGRYQLTTVAEAALPTPIFDQQVADSSGGFHLRIDAVGGWLELTSDGHYEHAVDFTSSIDGQPQPAPRWRDRGQYSLRGDTLDFSSEYIENVSFRGLVAPGRIHVEQNLAEPLAGTGQSLRYTYQD